MYSPYVSWYQVPKGYSKPKPFTEMFMKVQKTNNQTIYENIQYFPVALVVKCGCDFQKKLMLNREFQTHDIKLFSLSNCDSNEVMPEPLDLSVKSVIKNEPNQPSSCNNNYDLNRNNCQELDISTNIVSDDNKENCLSTVSSVEKPKVQNVENSDSSALQLSEQKTDDVVASTNIIYDNNEHSPPKKEDIQKTNMKAVERINIKQLNRKITKFRRRWNANLSNAINISNIVVWSVISSFKRRLFPRKRKTPPYRALRKTEKKSVLCQTTWEIERNIEISRISSRSVSLHSTCLATQEAYYSNDDPLSIEAREVSQEILSSSHDPLLSNNVSKLAQESYCSNSNASFSEGFPIINHNECNRLDNCSDRAKESFPERKDVPRQDLPALMDLDSFSTDKLLDLLSVEHNVFGNVPNELENFGLYYPLRNCGISQVDDEDVYISNADIKKHNHEEFLIKQENKNSSPVLEKRQTSVSTVTGACEKYQSPMEFDLKDNVQPTEQTSNLGDNVELARAGLKREPILIPKQPVVYTNSTLHQGEALGKSEPQDENNNIRSVPSEIFYGKSKKIVKNDNFTAQQEKNVAEKVDNSVTISIDQKYLSRENSRKRRPGALGNDKRNKRSRNNTDFVENLKEVPSKSNLKLQQKVNRSDQKSRESKSFIRNCHPATRTSSERRRALCFCEKNNRPSLVNIGSSQETDNILEGKSLKHKLLLDDMPGIKKDSTKSNKPSLKIRIPLSSLNATSSQTNDIVGKIIKESTAKRIDPPTRLRTRNPPLTTKQKNKVQSKSSIDFTFLPDYVPVLLKNTCPSLTPVHEPVYNFPSQNVHITVPIERKKPPVKKSGNSLVRDPRLKSRKRKKDQENEGEAGLDLLQPKRAMGADNDAIAYPNVCVSKEDLERNTFLITEILRDVSYGICATFGIALFDSKVAHQCPEMDTNMEQPEKNKPLNNEFWNS